MRRAVAERLAHGDALGIERVGDAADRRPACPPCGCPSASKCSSGPAFMVISGGWMMGPAFISAPESASPQSSITPGKARRDRRPARGPCSASGNTPVGRRLARTVMATSSGPCLRVSHGSVPVSAKATSARLPASRAALANSTSRTSPGGRNTTCPSTQMRRERAGDVGLRGRGRRAQDQLGAAHGLGRCRR